MKGSLQSRIYKGRLMHARLAPVHHAFEYPVYYFAFSIDELPQLGRETLWFGHNKFRPFSLYDSDYLDRGRVNLREKVALRLKARGIGAEEIGRIELVTTARYFGHAFNPVSFFYVYTANAQDELRCVLVQVNNTFGEMHLYILDQPMHAGAGQIRYQTAKAFHVSPFFDRRGDYEFRFSMPDLAADIQVNLEKDGQPVYLSRLAGRAETFNGRKLAATMLRFPLSALITLPRIHWQAARLYFGKKLPVFTRPAPGSPMTIRKKKPDWQTKMAETAVMSILSKAVKGKLCLVLPGGEKKIMGDPGVSMGAEIHIRDRRFFQRLVRDGGIGLGEGFMYGDWDSKEPASVVRFLIRNQDCFKNRSHLGKLGKIIHLLTHAVNHNSLKNSRRNIARHYDLSNEFFKTFLDPDMTYSCAVFDREETTLDEAQLRKISMLIGKLNLAASDHVLEIGCGWGAFAMEAVRQTGCRVTGITLSEKQLKLARERVAAAHMTEQIEIRLCDYRQMEGSFDKIVSVEMLEAVGHAYFGDFFSALDRLLKPGGAIALQVITIPDQRYDSYRRGCDFIQKHIFPGGHLPSLHALSESMLRVSSLGVVDLENVGPHYAVTLRRWHENFKQSRERIQKLGFLEHQMRAWEFYFAYCEAAFAERYLNCLQLVLTRPGLLKDGNQPQGGVHAVNGGDCAVADVFSGS